MIDFRLLLTIAVSLIVGTALGLAIAYEMGRRTRQRYEAIRFAQGRAGIDDDLPGLGVLFLLNERQLQQQREHAISCPDCSADPRILAAIDAEIASRVNQD